MSKNASTAILCILLAPAAAMAQAKWRAFNDLSWASDQSALGNVTAYATPTNGALKDYDTGTNLSVNVDITGGGYQPTVGVMPNSGTDAYNYFNGIVDGRGCMDYATNAGVLTFTGMDTGMTYTFVIFGCRAGTAYATSAQRRVTDFVISDVDSFVNDCSVGAQKRTTTVADDTTRITNGYNVVDGFVARWRKIDPGSNGSFVVTVQDGGSATPPKFYANAFMLRTAPEPCSALILALGAGLFALRRLRR